MSGKITEIGVTFNTQELAEEAIKAFLEEEPLRRYFISKVYSS
jgi:hypothetical protein